MQRENTRRFAARWVRLYFLLSIFPFPLDMLPGGDVVAAGYLKVCNRLFAWFNDRYWHLPVVEARTGSGDRAANYFMVLVFLVAALGLAAVWRRCERWNKWFDTYLRWNLAATMLLYGFAKVFHGQFAPLTVARLAEPIGQASPMGLLWAFMGFSRPYTIFAGLAEVLSGVLLLLPRFATLGALVGLGVMTNVFLLNMCYDVPVKIFSFHLILYALWLLALDRERLGKFIGGENVPAVKRLRVARGWLAVQALLALLLIGKIVYEIHGGASEYEKMTRDVPHFGRWKIREPAPDWKTAIFDIQGRLFLVDASGQFVRFRLTTRAAADGAEIQRFDSARPAGKIHITEPGANELRIDGEIDGKPEALQAQREAVGEFPLMTRGFHWINEMPYNK